MQQQPSTSQTHPTIRHFLDSNAIVLWFSGMGVLATALALPAFV